MTEWQPEETAPKNGTRVLMLVRGAEMPAEWSEEWGCWLSDGVMVPNAAEKRWKVLGTKDHRAFHP